MPYKNTYTIADVDRINEYLSECNESHELELTAKTYLIRNVCKHFKHERWKKHTIVTAVEQWMSDNTMDPVAMTELTRGKLPHVGKVWTLEQRERLRAARLAYLERKRAGKK